ncbi:MAG: Re/Si-specific NAD(P)(+) transhydrogenase subunit alpha [Acidobacteriota bacterium]
MKVAVPKETHPGEKRVPLIPAGAEKLTKLGMKVQIEAGMGLTAGYNDAAYLSAGATVAQDLPTLLAGTSVVLRIRKPPLADIPHLPAGGIHISFLDPFNERELIEHLRNAKVSTISMEMIPRTTRAQKMDALSSQANLAGYVAVILAADASDKIFPMMTTPAGTIAPAKVFVIGAGVAGLQAIATARRLGARVEAYDTRSVVEEQVKSLGAKFVKIDVGETGQTKDGYAKELTEEQLARQREAMANNCAQSDVVVTTAQVFGRRAPRILTADMVARMKPGSVIVDMAVESGGNVEGSECDRVVIQHGVKIIGLSNLPSRVCVHASQMYSNNLVALLEELWDGDKQQFVLNRDDEIVRGCLVTHEGHMVNETIQQRFK